MNYKKITIKVSDELCLKAWSVKDSLELFLLVDKNRQYLQPWLPWVPDVKTEQDSIKFISDAIKEFKSGDSLELGIWFSDILVGCIGLHGVNKSNRRASLGYWLSRDYQKRGIMTRSIRALIDYSFDTLNLNRIALEAGTENVASCAIAERLGFVKEGILRQFEFVNGRFLDYRAYSVLKSEWK